MSIINCPKCNKEISNQQISCHHCNYLLNPEIRKRILKNAIKSNQEPKKKEISRTKRKNNVQWYVLGAFICVIIYLISINNNSYDSLESLEESSTTSDSVLKSTSNFIDIPIVTKYSLGNLNIRKDPNIHSEIIGTFKMNDEVLTRLVEKNGYTQVIVDSSSVRGYSYGWCSSKYLNDHMVSEDELLKTDKKKNDNRLEEPLKLLVPIEVDTLF